MCEVSRLSGINLVKTGPGLFAQSFGRSTKADKLPALADGNKTAMAMPTSYNQIAGQSAERLAALSDGVFAVAMTLLLLELHAPARETVHTERELLHAMAAFLPQLAVYLMSFLTLGIFWVGQQTQLNHLRRSNRDLTWLHLAFLFAVTLMPVSTRFLTEFAEYRAALLAYWLNILLLGLLLYLSWGCATHASLISDDIPPEVPPAICRRIIFGQSLYAFGALLCVIGTKWSIGFIVLVQAYYAVAPKLRHRAQ
ncbi:MAG TPA: TMEM175 family protein [Candidatus Acidoferrum sp.]